MSSVNQNTARARTRTANVNTRRRNARSATAGMLPRFRVAAEFSRDDNTRAELASVNKRRSTARRRSPDKHDGRKRVVTCHSRGVSRSTTERDDSRRVRPPSLTLHTVARPVPSFSLSVSHSHSVAVLASRSRAAMSARLCTRTHVQMVAPATRLPFPESPHWHPSRDLRGLPSSLRLQGWNCDQRLRRRMTER